MIVAQTALTHFLWLKMKNKCNNKMNKNMKINKEKVDLEVKKYKSNKKMIKLNWKPINCLRCINLTNVIKHLKEVFIGQIMILINSFKDRIVFR